MVTTTNMEDIPAAGVRVVYDTAAVAPIIGADANHSILIPYPEAIQINTIPAGTTVQVQQKMHVSAEWVNVGAALGNADGPVFMIFDHRANFVQLVRTGAGAIKAYAQSGK